MGGYRSDYRGTWLMRPLFDRFVRLYLRLEVSGSEHLPQNGPFILAANHASHADTPVLFAALPGRLRNRVVAAAAQDYFFENPLRRAVARSLFNAVPVDRRPVPGRNPLRHAARALREGYGLLIFPEGTRSRDGGVGRFRSGIGRLAAQFPDVPIIPVWLDTADVLPKGAYAPRPKAVAVRFGPPIVGLADPARPDAETVAGAVREAVLRLRDDPPQPPPATPRLWRPKEWLTDLRGRIGRLWPRAVEPPGAPEEPADE